MSWQQVPATPYRVTADGQACTGAGALKAFSISGGTAAWTLYDNTAASGTILAEGVAPGYFNFGADGIRFTTGVYVDVGAGASSAIVYATNVK